MHFRLIRYLHLSTSIYYYTITRCYLIHKIMNYNFIMKIFYLFYMKVEIVVFSSKEHKYLSIYKQTWQENLFPNSENPSLSELN